MIRKIIEIDKDKCNGCGLCAKACHEGAIGIQDGKATLLRDDYCDGLGDCLPACPTGAITFIKREAAAYDEAAVLKHKETKGISFPCECQSQKSKIERARTSELQQWPVQIQLVPIKAPYFENADLLIAANCTAFAYSQLHADFMHHKITLIGCPKLDNFNYASKVTEIMKENRIKSLTVVRMEVPCCGGIQQAAIAAMKNSGRNVPLQVYTISTDGRISEI